MRCSYEAKIPIDVQNSPCTRKHIEIIFSGCEALEYNMVSKAVLPQLRLWSREDYPIPQFNWVIGESDAPRDK